MSYITAIPAQIQGNSSQAQKSFHSGFWERPAFGGTKIFTMVKLATARESRLYYPWQSQNKLEYINAGMYVFAVVLLFAGYLPQLYLYELSRDAKAGFVVLLVALVIITLVNVHDLFAHLAGIDFQLPLVSLDTQLGLVEFAVPIVQALGSVLTFLGILFLFIQEETGYGYFRLENHALNLLIAGPVLWVIGSIHNSCQIYERADGHIQILQESVHIPFLMGSLLFLVGAILNYRDQTGIIDHGLMILEENWVWLGILGSLLFLIGGLMNVVKVFNMQQIDGMRLETLRGGAQERLRENECQAPLAPPPASPCAF